MSKFEMIILILTFVIFIILLAKTISYKKSHNKRLELFALLTVLSFIIFMILASVFYVVVS